ncbi:MAG: isopeptide-forming domain-containing fimbrial protein [Vagococcus salmoninarum]|uniref:isopeptide-forming domain-containing fimbrial protein n=1 Tax=Vagococcus salmoninarum TaxID=2739 RepID=UPI003F99B905
MKQKHKNSKKKGFLSLVILLAVALLIGLRLTLNSQLKAAENSQESTTTEVSTKEETETTSEKEVSSSEDSQVDEEETETEEKDTKKDTKKTKEVKPKITQPQQDSTIYFAEPLVAEILTGDAQRGFDDNDNPGYDTSETNDIIRSYDKIFYSFRINLGSLDKKLYTDIYVKISGKVKNGVTESGQKLNAMLPSIYGGTSNLPAKKSEFIYKIGGTAGSEGANTGSNRTVTLPLEVYGAKNGTVLNIDDFDVQIMSAKNDQGVLINLEDEKIIEKVQGLKDIKVSSKVNLKAIVREAQINYGPFNTLTNSTDDPKANLRQQGVAVAVIPLADRGTSLLGSASPESKVTLKLSQTINLKNTNTGISKPLVLGTDIRPLSIFDYGNVASHYTNRMNTPYPNYSRLPSNLLYVPVSKAGYKENSVFDTGTMQAANITNNKLEISFENYLVNDTHMPIRPSIGASGIRIYPEYERYFLSGGYYLHEPTDPMVENTSLIYSTKIDEIKYTEDNVEKTIIPSGANVRANWELVKYPPGSIQVYTVYAGLNGNLLGTPNSGGTAPGDGKITMGQEYNARTVLWTRGEALAVESTVLQKFNPNEGSITKVAYSAAPTLGSILIKHKPIEFGVSKNGKYDIKSLNDNRIKDYDWYPTIAEAEKNGDISAVTGGGVGSRAGTGAESLYVNRKAKKNLGATDSNGDPFATVSWGEVFYDSEKTVVRQVPNPSVYRATTYNDKGLETYHNPPNLYGDTLLIVPFDVSIGKSSYKKGSTAATTEFQSSDTVSWQLTPVVSASTPGEQDEVEITVVDVLPKGMRYIIDSAKYGDNLSEPNISGPDGTGKTTLTWKLPATPGKVAPKITYDTYFVQSEVTFNDSGIGSLTNKVVIDAPGVITKESFRTKEHTVNIIKEQKWEIDKTVDIGLIEANSPNPVTYTLKVINQTGKDITDVKILDVLPTNLDDLGSTFRGDITLKSIKVLGNNGTTINPNAKTYYTFDDIERDHNPNTIENDFDGWDEYASGSGNIDEEATAVFASIPLLKDNESAYVKITVLPSGNIPGDRYRNTASGNSKNYSGIINSRVQSTDVINRKISGRVWYDADYDGGINGSESFKENVPVTLYKVGAGDALTKVAKNIKGTPFLDGSGNSIIKTKTDGSYEFDALAHGDYVVGFDVKAEVDAEELYITKQEAAGIAERNNSNVKNNPVALDGNNFLTPVNQKYSLPEVLLNPAQGVKEHINLGVLGKPTIEVQKKVLSEKDAAGKREDLNGKTVKVGDTIHYDIEVKNPKKNSVVEKVVVKDTIPEGLAFKAGTLTVTDQDGTETALDDSLFSGRILNTGDIGDILGEKGVLTVGFDVTIEKNASGLLKNIATVTGKVVDKPTDDEKTTNQVINDTPPLPTLAKGVDVESAKLGDILTYTLTVANKKGGGEWHNVVVTDELPIELSYVANSTQIDGVAKADTGIWSGRKLTLPLPNLQSEDSKLITFKVKVNVLPDSRKLVNKVNATGKDKDGKNYNPPEAQVETPMYHQLLHVRQVIINNDGKELVIPSTAYYRVSNQIDKGSTTKINQFALTSGSTTKDSSSEITESLFTTRFIELDKTVKGLLIEDMIPEYYKYVGHIATTDKAKLKEEHLSSKLPTDSGKQLAFVDFSKSEEYWVTIYLEPKFGKDKDDQPEESPRPYSWSNRINDFGVIK